MRFAAKLKDDLHHDVYTLHVPDFIKVFERVSQQSFIDEAAIFGSDIHLLCSRGFNLKRSYHSFKNQGITNFRIRRLLQP